MAPKKTPATTPATTKSRTNTRAAISKNNIPAKKTTTLKKAHSDGIIHDLSQLLVVKFIETIQDGRTQKPSVFIIDVQNSDTQHYNTTKRCILKSYPLNTRNKEFFTRELAANTELLRASAAKTVDEVYENIFEVLSNAPKERWPQCLGRLNISGDLLNQQPREWSTIDKQSAPSYPCLIFEYLPNLLPLTNDLLDKKLVVDILQMFSDLHAVNILHRDHVDHAAWPEIRFGNLFVRYNCATGCMDPVILDFNCATVLGSAPRDEALKKDELDRMDDLLNRLLLGKRAVDYVSKEVQRLL